MPKGKGYRRKAKRAGGRPKRLPKGRKRTPKGMRFGGGSPFKMRKT